MAKRGQQFRRKFSIPGLYEYYCQVHVGSGMSGKVIVEAATPNPSPPTRKPPPPPRQLSPPPPSGQPKIHEILAGNNAGNLVFVPNILNIKPNDVVRWVGNAGFPHNVLFFSVPVRHLRWNRLILVDVSYELTNVVPHWDNVDARLVE